MQKIRIDFDNPGLPQHISAVENDSQSRFFQATLYENGKAYTAPEGAAYSIMYHGFGPQNQGWYDTINDGAGKRAACAVSGNVVTCEIARQALQVPGHVSIVLCVTTGKGYMLKSWPIECNCKNDHYDSTAEIQSFFYVTQISNESWTQAIQAVEELKNTIDPTLSISGKAADAAKVGEAVNAEAERAKGVESQQISKFGIRKKYHKIFAKYNLPNELAEISSKINIYTDGSSVYHDFDIEKYKNSGGKIYYVAPDGPGSTSNSSLENPTQFDHILDEGILSDGDTIFFTDGIYRDIASARKKQLLKSVNLIALNKGKATIAMVGAPLQYVKGTNGIYSTKRTHVLKVFQLKDDNIFVLNKVTSENECEAQGTWNLSADDVLKIHLFDDEQPTYDNCIVCLNYLVPALDFNPYRNASLYCDGINFIGGTPCTASIIGKKGTVTDFFAVDCKFYGAYDPKLQKDAISVRGANAYFVRCEAQYSSKDGFNYHAQDGNVPNFVEIDCIGANNGNDGIAVADNQYWQNGSTAHDGVKGLRIGGYYYNNYGGNVADVHENTITVNIGCTGFDSSAPKNKPDACADFVAQQAGAKMLLLGCRAFGSVSSAMAVPNSEITVISCDLENGTSGTGTIN